MKQTLSTLGLSALLVGGLTVAGNSANAQSQSWFSQKEGKNYVTIQGGYQGMEDQNIAGAGDAEFDSGFGVSGAIGHNYGAYSFIDNVKGEIEVSYGSNDVDNIGGVAGSGKVENFSAMANMIHEYDTNTIIVPYYGVGAGWTRVEATDISQGGAAVLDGSETGFAYQLMAGVNYLIDPCNEVGVRYRYMNAPGIELAGDDSFATHAIMANYTYKF